MSNTKTFAERELDILAKTAEPGNESVLLDFVPEILALCEKFGNSGQSGGSAPYVAKAITSALNKLLLQNPILPITGIDEEWVFLDYGDNLKYQNKRDSRIFKHSDGTCATIDAIIWKGEEDWDTFTGMVEGISSNQFIKNFPFTHKKFYVDVYKEFLPEDYEGPIDYHENKYYSTSEYETTGIKNWKVEKYYYKIKDRSQLDEVFEYYKK